MERDRARGSRRQFAAPVEQILGDETGVPDALTDRRMVDSVSLQPQVGADGDAGRAHAPLPAGLSLLLEPDRADPRGAELDTDDVARVFGQAAELGVLQVHISGGEPLSRRDLEPLVARARARGCTRT